MLQDAGRSYSEQEACKFSNTIFSESLAEAFGRPNGDCTPFISLDDRSTISVNHYGPH